MGTEHPLLVVPLASLSNMTGATVTNPVDVIKTRMQLHGQLQAAGEAKPVTWLQAGQRVVAAEGVRGLYKGLTPSLLRESTYSGIRLGFYEPFKYLFGATDPAHTPLWKKIAAGACSGALGSALASPTDLVKVRLQADITGTLYPSTLGAFRKIYVEEGLKGLYRGVGPTMKRAAVLTATQIPAYDHTKHTLLNAGVLKEGLVLHAVSSMVAGFCAAVTTSPVDVIKTRMMSQPTDAAGRGQLYTNAFDCMRKTMAVEGVAGLYKGFNTQWLRIGPHTIVTFMVFEELRKLTHIRPV